MTEVIGSGLEVVGWYRMDGRKDITPYPSVCATWHKMGVKVGAAYSDSAHAIIDGLRGELRSLEEYAAGRMNKNHDLRQQLNRQGRRIAELEAVMRAIQRMPADDEFAENVIGLIDATLSAGKEGE